jgi:Reverse transcriptase (RNA-dependent DNA polymerase)/4-alpha-glucanotransferase
VSDSLSQPGVSVEKGSELILVTLRYSRYKQARVADAAHRHPRRPLPFVEDLGIITPDVQSLRDRFQLPGMRVLQFAFDVIRTVRICLTASSPIPWRTLGRMTITNPGMVRRVAGLSDEESELVVDIDIVLEDGKRIRMEEGMLQGGSASPLPANVYLHYLFDLWVQAWRRKHAHGDVIVVRFADNIVVGFQGKSDARQFQGELTEQMQKFDLQLHPEKKRLLEFGPSAAKNRKQRGEGRPETFNFLGFTHICGKKRGNRRFTVLWQTIRKRCKGS